METFFVMKQKLYNLEKGYRYRYRIDGEDYGLKYLSSCKNFKFKYCSNMTETDIKTVEELWKDKLIK